nr:putative ribonuclease H-like domain-containing protein [Tanacetum cinerariifolium]
MPPKPDLVFNNAPNDVETNHPSFNVKLSPTKPDQHMSYTHRHLEPIIEDWVSDSEDESETKTPQNVPSFVQPTEQVKSLRPSVQHVETSISAATHKPASLKPTSNGKHRNRKACFVCKSLDHLIKDCDYHEKKMAQPTGRNHVQRGNYKQYAQMTLLIPQRHVVPAAVLNQSKHVPITAVRSVSTAVCKISVTRPRQTKTVVTKPNSPPRRHINRSPSLKPNNSPPRVTSVKAPVVNAAQGNPQHALKDKWVIDSGCSRHMTGNMSYLFDFEELNDGYIAFGSNPNGGMIFGKGKIRTGKLDFDDVYFVKELKFNLFSVSQMCDKKNSVLFTDTECLVLSPEFKLPDENQVLLRVPRENNMYNNTDGDSAFDEKEPEFDEKKHESEVNVSPSSSTQSKKHDDKTKRKAKGKSPIESFIGYINLSAEFEDFSDNSINEVNAAGTLVPIVWQISPTNTNTFSATGPSNADASPTHGKYSCIDTSQLPDDPDMPELEDITYSDDEDDVGVEVDFNNLETSITVSPIPTIRVHKDHPVTQIIGDLSLATQTRNMTRVAKDQGGLSQINNDDFHTCMFACFLLQEEPKRVHQGLKDPSWIEAMQEELLQFKMHKVWVLVDLPHGKRAIGTKWVFKNKKDKRGIVVRNKARLVAQGHTQEEGIDYEEVFASVARIEAIRLFLAYASFIEFMVYQMDVKSAFLYETIEEELYVCQPPGFEDPDYPDKVYKVVKGLYGLHQALRAWYETLAKYLLKNGFQKGKIDQTLFIKRQKGDILLVQIYVDDIICGSTNKDLCKDFEKLMKGKFQMSSIGELTFFLGLQVKQK